MGRAGSLRSIIAWVLGVALATNGVFMLLLPEIWYATIPGVPDTGPLNPHFVRDVGCSYVTVGAALVWFGLDARARAAVLAGGVFLTLHALIHLWDVAAGREVLGHILREVPTVFGPAAVAFWAAWPCSRFHKEGRHAQVADAAADRRF